MLFPTVLCLASRASRQPLLTASIFTCDLSNVIFSIHSNNYATIQVLVVGLLASAFHSLICTYIRTYIQVQVQNIHAQYIGWKVCIRRFDCTIDFRSYNKMYFSSSNIAECHTAKACQECNSIMIFSGYRHELLRPGYHSWLASEAPVTDPRTSQAILTHFQPHLAQEGTSNSLCASPITF